MKDPLVTVLMSVYNGEKYLRLTIESILAQTYRDFEFLIINDCSTDNSLEIIQSFRDPRIIAHTNSANLGQTKSLNSGLKLARGKYVARIDADDMAFPTWLKKIVDYIEEHPEYIAVSVSAVVIDGSGTPKRLHKTPNNFQKIIVDLFFGKAMNHVGAILNKKVIIENGGYNEDFKVAQDYELWSTLIRNDYRIINIPEVSMLVRVHEDSHGFREADKKGLAETAETIARTVNSLTSLNISHDEAVKLRLFYRVPYQLTIEDFKWTLNMYTRIFENLKDRFKIDPKLLKKSLKSRMLRPFCIRAVYEIENKRLKIAREINKDYIKLYGLHIMPLFLFLITFAGFRVSKKIAFLYEGWSETITKLFLKIKLL